MGRGAARLVIQPKNCDAGGRGSRPSPIVSNGEHQPRNCVSETYIIGRGWGTKHSWVLGGHSPYEVGHPSTHDNSPVRAPSHLPSAQRQPTTPTWKSRHLIGRFDIGLAPDLPLQAITSSPRRQVSGQAKRKRGHVSVSGCQGQCGMRGSKR